MILDDWGFEIFYFYSKDTNIKFYCNKTLQKSGGIVTLKNFNNDANIILLPLLQKF